MQLAPVDREAIVLVMVQELGYAAAASVSGCPVGTLKSRISRARRKLRALLSPPNDRGRGSATSSKAKAA
jgi:RNA polymerase sigma-70 factor (ECF subfamily)